VIAHIRITPPDEPSRAMARESATWRSVQCDKADSEFGARTVFHEFDCLVFAPSILVRSIAITVDVRGSTASNGPRLPEDTTSKRNIVHTRTVLLVPPSNDDPCTQRVFVLIADILE
jgi:hypothetical protein